MPTGYFSGVFGEIILFAFRLFISAVLLRFLLHWVRADFRFNPLARALVKITNPALTPLRRFIPGYKGVDWAAIVLMLALAMIGIALVLGLSGRAPSLPGLIILAIAELMTITIKVLYFSIFLIVIVSWIAPGTYNPAVDLVRSIVEPLMRPARQIIPPIGGLDLSPILVLFFLYLTERLVVNPLQNFGFSLA